jgi:hypothetical protein
VLKHIENYRKNIEFHRNPEGLEKERFTGENPYFLRFSFERSFLHTVGVTGSFKKSCHPCLRFFGRRRDCQLSSLAILTSALAELAAATALRA